MKRVLMMAALWWILAPAGAALAVTNPAEKPAKVEICYGCHEPVKELHAGSKHKNVNCVACHSGIENHLADASKRPVTRTDLAACGTCHQNQYQKIGRAHV